MKNYKVSLYVGSIFVGTYDVMASDEESAQEMAWDIASISFNGEAEEIKVEE